MIVVSETKNGEFFALFKMLIKKQFIFEHADKKLFPDEHDVDIIGYGGASDDDHSSVRRCILRF